MEGFLPCAAVFFLEATPDQLATNIPKHTLMPYFAVMTVEEWAANSIAAYEFSYDIWAAGEARDATAPRPSETTPQPRSTYVTPRRAGT